MTSITSRKLCASEIDPSGFAAMSQKKELHGESDDKLVASAILMLASLQAEETLPFLSFMEDDEDIGPLVREVIIFSKGFIDKDYAINEYHIEPVDCDGATSEIIRTIPQNATSSGYGRGAGFDGTKSDRQGVSAGDAIILGALDKSLIDRVIESHLAQIRYCYQKELAKNPNLSGKIVVKFTITSDGTVSSATTKSSTMQNVACEECVNSQFLRMRFPQPKGGGMVVVSYPLAFQ